MADDPWDRFNTWTRFKTIPVDPGSYNRTAQQVSDAQYRARPDRMRPEETTARKGYENPRRLPWCARCNQVIPAVEIQPLPTGRKSFTVRCHGQVETTLLDADEFATITGYGRAFAAEGVR